MELEKLKLEQIKYSRNFLEVGNKFLYNAPYDYGLDNESSKLRGSFPCNGTLGDVAKFITDEIKEFKKVGIVLSRSPTMVPRLATSEKLEDIPEDTTIYFMAKW